MNDLSNELALIAQDMELSDEDRQTCQLAADEIERLRSDRDCEKWLRKDSDDRATDLAEALIALLPFVDDAGDVHGFMFPESAASNDCRAAVAAAKAALDCNWLREDKLK